MILSIDQHVLYKGTMFMSKNKLKTILSRLALKDKFEYQIKRSSKTRFEASCKDIAYKFQLHVVAMQGGIYWTIAKFVKEPSCELELFRHYPQQVSAKVISSVIILILQDNGRII